MTTDKKDRKERPIARGVLDYFPDAIAEVANVSYVGNQQHNPGEEMHWARGKSNDHADCIVRHLLDRGMLDNDGLRHSAKAAWRALALLQEEIEKDDPLGCLTRMAEADGAYSATAAKIMQTQPRRCTVVPRNKPFVYIASPYTKGDVALNTRYQMKIFDMMLDDGVALPYIPLWTHFQHILFPRPYQQWIDYDLELIRRHTFNACVRLSANYGDADLQYHQAESAGADGEVKAFEDIGLPVFYGLPDLYNWVRG